MEHPRDGGWAGKPLIGKLVLNAVRRHHQPPARSVQEREGHGHLRGGDRGQKRGWTLIVEEGIRRITAPEKPCVWYAREGTGGCFVGPLFHRGVVGSSGILCQSFLVGARLGEISDLV